MPSRSRSSQQLDLALQGRRTVESPGAYAANGHFSAGYAAAASATATTETDSSDGDDAESSNAAQSRSGNARQNGQNGHIGQDQDSNGGEDDDDNDNNTSPRSQTVTRHGLVASDEVLRELENRYVFHYTEVCVFAQRLCKSLIHWGCIFWTDIHAYTHGSSDTRMEGEPNPSPTLPRQNGVQRTASRPFTEPSSSVSGLALTLQTLSRPTLVLV